MGRVQLPHSQVFGDPLTAVIVKVVRDPLRERTSFGPVQGLQIRDLLPGQVLPSGQVNRSQKEMKPDQADDHQSKQAQKQSQHKPDTIEEKPR